MNSPYIGKRMRELFEGASIGIIPYAPKGDEFGTLESVKAVSELYMPMSGEVVAVNTALSDAPELINQQPYTSWIIEIKPSAPSEYQQLHNAADYLNLLKG